MRHTCLTGLFLAMALLMGSPAFSFDLTLRTDCSCDGPKPRCELTLENANVRFKQILQGKRDSDLACRLYILNTEQFSGTTYQLTGADETVSGIDMVFGASKGYGEACWQTGSGNSASTSCDFEFHTVLAVAGGAPRYVGTPPVHIMGKVDIPFSAIAGYAVLAEHNFFSSWALKPGGRILSFIKQP
jgi:hypothetical protein